MTITSASANQVLQFCGIRVYGFLSSSDKDLNQQVPGTLEAITSDNQGAFFAVNKQGRIYKKETAESSWRLISDESRASSVAVGPDN